MPYNPPYYSSLFAGIGLETEVTLFGYHYDLRRPLPEKLVRVAARAGRNEKLKIRSVNFNNPEGEGEVFSLIHNSSMHEIWGFAALSPEEGSAIWQKLRGHYDPAMILVAEVEGMPAALCLVLCPLQKKFFPGPAGTNARLAVLAVLPRYRLKGLEAALIIEFARRARARGVVNLELSLVAENNTMMNRIIQSLPGVIRSREYKVYKR
jgi:GNAT superfamily N-acetyltransferase